MPIRRNPIDDKSQNTLKADKKVVVREQQVSFYAYDPKYAFDEVVLTEKVNNEINCFITLIKNSNLILNEWGLSSVIKHCNKNINLYGASGTGKTITAHAIANAINKKIVPVNYSEIESKYVGETSKNIVRLFEFAEMNDAVILFDEADALLSKRVTSMFSATDVSVNQTRNVLLRILDEYSGVVIFTTNFIQNFDSAFMRRIFTHVKFELPDYETRKKLWSHYIVDRMPVENREELIEQVSSFENISGSDISTAVIMASIEAINSGKKSITYDTLKMVIETIQSHKNVVNEKYEIATQKISKETVAEEIKGGK